MDWEQPPAQLLPMAASAGGGAGWSGISVTTATGDRPAPPSWDDALASSLGSVPVLARRERLYRLSDKAWVDNAGDSLQIRRLIATPNAWPQYEPEEVPRGKSVEYENPQGEYFGDVTWSVGWSVSATALKWYDNPSTATPLGWLEATTATLARLPSLPSSKPGAGVRSGWPRIGSLTAQYNDPAAETVTTFDGGTEEFLSVQHAFLGSAPPAPAWPEEITTGISVTSSVSVNGAVLGVTAVQWYQPARWRFVPNARGMWNLRQRQSLTGNAGGWPLRQRQTGGATGSWPLRQRQTGT